MSLMQHYRSNTGLPINKHAHYLPLYERYFSNFRNRSIFFLEIGTGQGGSSRMWSQYFGPKAQVVTIDNRDECRNFAADTIEVRIGDQSSSEFLQSIIEEFGRPDIVLDDGSHIMEHVKASFRYLYPQMSRDGVYFVEDMCTAYWPDYGGALRRPGTFIEEMKSLIDEINSGHAHHEKMRAGPMPSSPISRLTSGVHFHPDVVVIEKGPFVDMAQRSIPHEHGKTIW